MSGFGAHYKGDVSEVTMGHETGLMIQSHEPIKFKAITDDNRNYTTIEFIDGGLTNAVDNGIFENNKPILKVPLGMLIGQKLTFHAHGSGVTAFTEFFYRPMNNLMYTIVDHVVETNSEGDSGTRLKIVPAFKTSSDITSHSGDSLFIHSQGLPTIQSGTSSAWHTNAKDSKEVSLIDQFVGLASFMTLPDTKVDVHRYHVVGMGRQAAVQQTGKVHHMGGSLEMPMHNAKWLYYCLGREVVDRHKCGNKPHLTPVPTILSDVNPGQTHIDVLSSTGSSNIEFGALDADIGDYLLIVDTTLVPTVQYKTPSKGSGTEYWPKDPGGLPGSNLGSDADHFEWTETSEIRRITAIENLSTTDQFRIYLDGPVNFSHTTSDTLQLRKYADDGDSPTYSPHVNPVNRTIMNPVHRLMFSGDTIPSFSIEHSIRTQDVGSYNATGESTIAPADPMDSKQLTRIFRGCKIAEWEISSTVDAELKFRAIFDALSCYTDTGRLESASVPANRGDRYTAHRMFQNTADTLKNRKVAGIAAGSEKPFMFYNGTIEAFGDTLGLVSGFELRGKTGVELFHTIQGNPVAESVDSATGLSLKQVPYGGTRNASIIREGREEFELEIDLALTDATLFHRLRTHALNSGTVGSSGGTIMLHFTKPVTTAGVQYTTPSMRIVMDDYHILDCPIPIPDDKGLLHTKIMLQPQNVKVITEDTVYQS